MTAVPPPETRAGDAPSTYPNTLDSRARDPQTRDPQTRDPRSASTDWTRIRPSNPLTTGSLRRAEILAAEREVLRGRRQVAQTRRVLWFVGVLAGAVAVGVSTSMAVSRLLPVETAASPPVAAASVPPAQALPSDTSASAPAVSALSADEATAISTAIHAHGSVRIAVSGSGGALHGTGVLRYTTDGVLMRFSAVAAGQHVTVIIRPEATYLGGVTGLKPGTWVRLDPAAKDPLSVSLKGLVDEIRVMADPAALSTSLSDTRFTEGTTQSIEGVAVRSYVARVDYAKQVADLPSSARQVAQNALGSGQAQVELAIGSDHLPVRVVSTGAGQSMAAGSTVVYQDWGAAVVIAAPTTNVIDLAAALKPKA